MASVPNPLESLGFSKEFLATRRAKYVEEDAQFVIEDVRCGVLFFMAFWSGPARKAFAELKRTLAELDTESRIELIVIDVDGCTRLWTLPEFGVGFVGGGHGEAAWVMNGKIVSTTGSGFHPECMAPNTRQLLEACRTH